MIRLLLVDDQELVRAGLRAVLRRELGFEVVGECGDGGEAAAAVRELRPDAVLMDVRMPRVDGVTATRELRQDPDAKVDVGSEESMDASDPTAAAQPGQKDEPVPSSGFPEQSKE